VPWENAVKKYKETFCQFLSTDQRLLDLLVSHPSYRFTARLSPAIFYFKTAVTMALARLLLQLVVHMAAEGISSMLRRMKEEKHHEKVEAALSVQLLGRRKQMRSLATAPTEAVVPLELSVESTGGWLPSDSHVRDHLLVKIESMRTYMQKFTSSNCLIGRTLAIDDSGKVGKGSSLWKKTAMNEYGLVEMSCFGDTQSYETARAQHMGSEWGDARLAVNAPPLAMVKLDNPSTTGAAPCAW